MSIAEGRIEAQDRAVVARIDRPIASVPAQDQPPARFSFLDGLRGLAALYVLLFHSTMELLGTPERTAIRPGLAQAVRGFGHGSDSVCIFIVLSGFCLALPLARKGLKNSTIDFRRFMIRRAWRILPPYYAALILSLILIAVVPTLNEITGARSDKSLPAFTPGAVTSHLLLVHNVTHAWSSKINGPMWTIATEWQLYFALPLLLLPLAKKLGLPVMLGTAFAISVVPYILRPNMSLLLSASPWFLFLFAIGIAAAYVSISPASRQASKGSRVPWSAVAVSAFTVMAFLAIRPDMYVVSGGIGAVNSVARIWWFGSPWLHDSAVGLSTAALIIACIQWSQRHASQQQPILVRMLSSRWVAGLGAFSYSLYLIHSPLLSSAHIGLKALGWSADARLIALLFGAVPLIVCTAYAFHCVFERPFLNKRQRTDQAVVWQTETSAQPVSNA